MSNTRSKNSIQYSTLWRIFSTLKTAAIFALVLLDNPTTIIAHSHNDLELAPPKTGRLTLSEAIANIMANTLALPQAEAESVKKAIHEDNVEQLIELYGKSDFGNFKSQNMFVAYQFPQTQVQVKTDSFGQMCIAGKEKIAKYLLDKGHYDAKLFPHSIAAAAWNGKKDLLKSLELSKEQVTEAFVWLNDLQNRKRIFTSYQIKNTYKKALRLLVSLGANVNSGKESPLSFFLGIGDIDMVRYFLKNKVDMYKITSSGVMSRYLAIPLEYLNPEAPNYAEILNLFCENGYNIHHPEPQHGKDLANMILDIYTDDKIFSLIEKLKTLSHTKELAKEIQQNHGLREKQILFSIITIAVLCAVGKIIDLYTARKSRLEQVKKIKEQLDKHQAEKESVEKEKNLNKKLRRKSIEVDPNKMNDIPITMEAAKIPAQPKEVKHPPKKSAAQLRAEEIAKAKELAHKEKELALLKEKELARIAKELAEAHKLEWKKKQEAEKEARLKLVLEEKHKKENAKKEEKQKKNSDLSASSSQRSYTTNSNVLAAVQHAANIVVICALKEDKKSEHYELNSLIHHLALLYNIHRYNLSMLSYMMANSKYKTSTELIFAKEMRNLMMHGDSIQESKEIVVQTANQMKEIMPQDLERLTKIHSHQKAVDENDIKQLIELAGIGKLQTIFLTSMEETPLYKSLAKKAGQKISNNFAEATTVYDEDSAYYGWVIKKIFPLVNRISSPIIKNANVNVREYFGEALDGIKMLLSMCGEYYNLDRKKRFHEAKIKNNLHAILTKCHDLRNEIAHASQEVSDQDILDLCREIPKCNPELCGLHQIDIAVQAAATSSVSTSSLALFSRPNSEREKSLTVESAISNSI